VRKLSYRTSFKPTDFALFTHEHYRFGFSLQYAVKSFLQLVTGLFYLLFFHVVFLMLSPVKTKAENRDP
jgi:hypothetical protein